MSGQANHVVVPPTNLYPRIEIREFSKNPTQWSLFIRAVIQMQKLKFQLPVAFEAIAGIHGAPYVEYDNATSSSDWTPGSPETRWGGYCQHGTVLFPPWHRPYCLLIEQAILEQARLIASTAAEKEACEQLRHPFWDWANTATQTEGVPDELTARMIDIVVPDGMDGNKTLQIDNPLASFTVFETLGEPDDDPVAAGFETFRRGGASVGELNDYIASQSKRWARQLATVLGEADFFKFSNHTHANSLEGLHDGIHVAIGGRKGGAMSDPDFAAYDPIFFMHHCQVDRVFALWQQAHSATDPFKTVGSHTSGNGTFTIPNGEPLDAGTSLWPFRKSQTDYWTAADAWDIHALGYTYDGIQTVRAEEAPQPERLFSRRPDIAPAPLGAAAAAALVDAGPGQGPQIPVSGPPTAPLPSAPGVQPATAIPNESDPARQRAQVLHAVLHHVRPQIGNKQVVLDFPAINKNKLGGPFEIRAFVNNPDATKRTSIDDPSYGGAVAVFARRKDTRCARCQETTMIRGQIDLTAALENLDLDPDVVDPFEAITSLTVFAVRSAEPSDTAEADEDGAQVTLEAMDIATPAIHIHALGGDGRRLEVVGDGGLPARGLQLSDEAKGVFALASV